MEQHNSKIILCTDPFLKEHLKIKGIEAVVFDSILNPLEKTQMLERLDNFACSWFANSKGQDFTLYRDISIGASIHDEIMVFFYLLVHFTFLMDKINITNKKIIFYQSESCKMPGCILEMISFFGGGIITCNCNYPYLCYQTMFNRQTSTTYSFISYYFKGKEKFNIKKYFRGLRPLINQVISQIAGIILLSKRKKNAHLLIMRRLVEFYDKYLKNPKKEYGLILSHHSLMEPSTDKRNKGFASYITNIIKLTKKGINITSFMPTFFFKCLHNYKTQKEHKELAEVVQKTINIKLPEYFHIKDKSLEEYLKETFRYFYLENLFQFMRIIDFNYGKFSSCKVSFALQEFVHPFQAQVMAKYKKKSFLLPNNSIMHNQYFTPLLFHYTESFFKVIAVSKYDAGRYKQLGFNDSDIKVLNLKQEKLKAYKTVNNVKGASFLILPPYLPSLHTYRINIDSTYLTKYMYDVLDILENLGASRVKIRPHPGSGKYNQFGSNELDCHKYILKTYKRNWKLDIDFSDQNYNSLTNDVLDCDIVIGTISGSILQVLNLGKDFIYYDSSIAPFWGLKDRSVFSENDGILKRINKKEDLFMHLKNYVPLDRELFLKKYFDGGTVKSLCNEISILLEDETKNS